MPPSPEPPTLPPSIERALALIPPEDQEAWRVLWAPFHPTDLGSFQQGPATILFIRAPILMARLDDAVGPGNWEDRYAMRGNLIVCSLSLTFPSGRVATRRDAGAKESPGKGMDEGDSEKAGFSDAFKRTTKKFGIARYLDKSGASTMPELAIYWHGQEKYDGDAPQGYRGDAGGSRPRQQAPAPIAPSGPAHDPAPAPDPRLRQAASHAPRTAKELYPWARTYGLIQVLEDYAKEKGWATQLKSWTDEMIGEAIPAVLGKSGGVATASFDPARGNFR